MANDEHYTPSWVFEALGLTFDLDVASSNSPYVVVPTIRRYTINDDGLNKPWQGLIWMNPPFSGVTPWVDKWIEHGNGFCMVPLASQGRWVNKLWESGAVLTYMPPNMRFIGGKDNVMCAHRWRIALWAIGDVAVEALLNSGIGKVR
jgi:hypothetical protein